MARYQAQRTKIDYPMGSVSYATMRPEDLIPAFTSELEYRAKHDKHVAFKTRKAHLKLVQEIESRTRFDAYSTEDELSAGLDYYQSEDADDDLSSLFDALDAYSAPYFYFGSHPGDGADYGYWLSESWDEDFMTVSRNECGRFESHERVTFTRDNYPSSIKVNDLADVPPWFRGEVAVVSDHGNISLYIKTSRAMREIWSVV